MTIPIGYLETQKKEFEGTHHLMPENNHMVHNADPEYWYWLLGDIGKNPVDWDNKVALDFGCGCGRNLKNLLDLATWKEVHGCDISRQNAEYAYNWANSYYPNKIKTWENNGKDIQPCDPETYDFIMSHVVFQHISNYTVRYSILTDMYSALKPDGIISIHYMDMIDGVPYYTNSNEYGNCRIDNASYLIEDFTKIGFRNVICEVGKDLLTKNTSYYVKGVK